MSTVDPQPPAPAPSAPSAPPAPPTVARAGVEVLRIYDVGEGFDLARVEALLRGRAAPVGRIRLARVPPKAIAFDDPPVVTDLAPVALEAAGERVEARAAARIYSFGVVSLSLDVRLPRPLPWGEFAEFARDAERAAAALPFWRASLDALVEALGPALEDPVAADERMEEDYAVVTVRELDPPLAAAELAERADLVPLLTHERRPLAPGARADALRHRHGWYEDDLVVLGWERALVVDPSHEEDDVGDVLEVANAQLLALRYYDALLDAELPRVYDRAAAVRRGWTLSSRGYASAANGMRALVAEVTQVTEKVENVLKVTEDVYLARIYGSALELYRVPAWTASIDRKLALIRDTYTALYDEAVATRTELLEAAIVLLIVLEIVLAFVLD